MAYKYSPPPAPPPGVSREDIELEFVRWNAQAGEPVIMSDYDLPMMRKASDSALVRFILRGNQVTVEIDQWNDFAVNLRCAYLVIRDMRLTEARGAGKALATAGAQAYGLLEAPEHHKDPYEVIGVHSTMHLEDIKSVYRSRARRLGEGHPELKQLNVAMQAIEAERR